MGSLHALGGASIPLLQFFGCPFGLDSYSFCHASIIHYLNGFDITSQQIGQQTGQNKLGNCDAECQTAKQSLLKLWSQRDANAQDALYLAGAIDAVLGIIASLGNVPGLLQIISMVLLAISALPAIFQYINYHYNHPAWVQQALPILDTIAGIASSLNMFVGLLSFGFAFAAQTAAKIAIGAITSVAFIVLSGTNANLFMAQEEEDQDNVYRYDLQYTWSPAVIIQQCELQGGTSC
jgi:hypothetical protein